MPRATPTDFSQAIIDHCHRLKAVVALLAERRTALATKRLERAMDLLIDALRDLRERE